MFSENDSQELKVDLAEKSVRQRPPSNQWQPTTTTRSGFYHVGWGTHISLKASKVHWNLGLIAAGSERYLEKHKPCHFKVKLALLKVDKADFVKNAFQEGVIDINSESNHHNNPWMILACSPSQSHLSLAATNVCIVHWIACKRWSICFP